MGFLLLNVDALFSGPGIDLCQVCECLYFSYRLGFDISLLSFQTFRLTALLFSTADNLNAEINCGTVDPGLLGIALEIPVFMSIDAISTW